MFEIQEWRLKDRRASQQAAIVEFAPIAKRLGWVAAGPERRSKPRAPTSLPDPRAQRAVARHALDAIPSHAGTFQHTGSPRGIRWWSHANQFALLHCATMPFSESNAAAESCASPESPDIHGSPICPWITAKRSLPGGVRVHAAGADSTSLWVDVVDAKILDEMEVLESNASSRLVPPASPLPEGLCDEPADIAARTIRWICSGERMDRVVDMSTGMRRLPE